MVAARMKDIGYKRVEADTPAVAINSAPAIAVGFEMLLEWVQGAPAAL